MGLGTDVAGGYSISILDAMRFTLNISKILTITGKASDRLSTSEVFFLATLGGAQVLSMDDITGNFLPGKQFDGLIVSLEGASQKLDVFEEVARAAEPATLLEKFIYSGDDRNIRRVYVNGRVVHERG